MKYLKLGIKIGVVWAVAETTKEVMGKLLALALGKGTLGLDKKLDDLDGKLKAMRAKRKEEVDAEKKEEGAEEDFEDFLE